MKPDDASMTANPEDLVRVRRWLREVRPQTSDELHGYCRAVLGFAIPRCARIPGMSAPFDYVQHAFFESNQPRDCVVWANRGGGKTQLGAITTFLDLLFKPGIQIRILGGSLDQSSKMYTYLRNIIERDELIDLVGNRITGRRITLNNGSSVEILAQSEASIRGQRVQKLRCDEVDLFSPDMWQAAQFVTRSARCGDTYVNGSIEAFSTMHKPFGMMQRLIESAAASERRVFKWGVIDVLEHCPPERDCDACALWSACGGIAKASADGFLTIDDAIQQQRRSSPESWRAEMLCERVDRSDCVFADFEPDVHIMAFELPRESDSVLWVGGMDFGFRSPTVFLWGFVENWNAAPSRLSGRPMRSYLSIIDEYHASERTIDQHLAAIHERPWPAPAWIGIDPAGYQRHEHTGTSSAALLRQAGFTIRARRLQLRAGLEAVRARIRTADGHVSLRIHPRCKHLIKSLRTYHFPPDSPEASEPVKDGSDHACDALRYLVINLDRPKSSGQVIQYT